MTRDNVIPFPGRPPSQQELQVYSWMTRGWSPALRRLICPQYFQWPALPYGESGKSPFVPRSTDPQAQQGADSTSLLPPYSSASA